MSLSTSQLVKGHLYSGKGCGGYRLLCIVDPNDVWYRVCSLLKQGGLAFGEVERCHKSTFSKWGEGEVYIERMVRRGEEGFDERDIDMIMAVSGHHKVGNSRGEIRLSDKATALNKIAEEFAESIRAETRDEIESYRSLLREILADQETMKEPYRNEALCEKIRAAIKESV